MIELYVPKLHEMSYRQMLLSDAATMEYNKGYDLAFEGYCKQTGCIDFPAEQWEKWYRWFVCGQPDRFYAYLKDEQGNFVGDVNFHKNESENAYEIGIVIQSDYRGNGYGAKALRLLLRQAFEVFGLEKLCNSFETTRTAAKQIHLNEGFVIETEKAGILRLSIDKNTYLKNKLKR